MYATTVPQTFRPGGYLRTPQLGLDLPSDFFGDLKALDPNFFVIWHPFELHWSDIINQYSGELEDPRLTISISPHYGNQELWGWVMTDGQGRPRPDNKWHVWRLCPAYGWAHVFPIANTHGAHLQFYLERIHIRTQIQDKYGIKGWQRFEKEEQALKQQKRQTDHANTFSDVMKANSRLMREAKENMERGLTAATNPTKDVIRSYSGQTHHSRIEVPLSDKEGGFIAPE